MSIRSASFEFACVSVCLGGIGISPRAMAEDDQPLALTIEATEQEATEQTDDADVPAADAVEADAVVNDAPDTDTADTETPAQEEASTAATIGKAAGRFTTRERLLRRPYDADILHSTPCSAHEWDGAAIEMSTARRLIFARLVACRKSKSKHDFTCTASLGHDRFAGRKRAGLPQRGRVTGEWNGRDCDCTLMVYAPA